MDNSYNLTEIGKFQTLVTLFSFIKNVIYYIYSQTNSLARFKSLEY